MTLDPEQKPLSDEQMDVLRHDHVSNYNETTASSNLLEDFKKQVPAARGAQQRTPMITTKGDEVQVSGAIAAMQTPGHDGMLLAGRVACL